jgi:hypothetical protein
MKEQHTTQYKEKMIIYCWNKEPSMVFNKPNRDHNHFPHNFRDYMTILFIIRAKSSHAHQMAI